jgi:hypothetical protein
MKPIALALALCLLGACGIHVADLLRYGWLPYRFAPLSCNIYWTSLTLLDALVAIVLLLQTSFGLLLALVIITSDVAINLFELFGLGLHVQSLPLLLQIFFFVVVAAANCYA